MTGKTLLNFIMPKTRPETYFVCEGMVYWENDNSYYTAQVDKNKVINWDSARKINFESYSGSDIKDLHSIYDRINDIKLQQRTLFNELRKVTVPQHAWFNFRFILWRCWSSICRGICPGDWRESSSTWGDRGLLHGRVYVKIPVPVFEVAQGTFWMGLEGLYYMSRQEFNRWTATFSTRILCSIMMSKCGWTTAWQNVIVSVLVFLKYLIMRVILPGILITSVVMSAMMCEWWLGDLIPLLCRISNLANAPNS